MARDPDGGVQVEASPPTENADLFASIQLIGARTFRLILLVEMVVSVWRGQYLVFMLATLALALSFLPGWLRGNYRIFLPIELEFLLIALIFASLFLGEIRGFYERIWWWDALLHTSAGFAMGLLGFTLVFVLNGSDRVVLQLSPLFLGLFSFAFAEAIGVLWEIFEFGMDQFFGLNMQKSGLVDTMWDLIVNTVGAAVVSAAGAMYIRRGDGPFFERTVRQWLAHRRGAGSSSEPS